METKRHEALPGGPPPDSEIVARVVEGDVAAFELLMRRHNQRVFRVCRAVLKSDVEAEDAAQQAWVDAYTHLASFEGRASLATWLCRIALHGSLARARKLGRELRLVEEEHTMDGPDPEEGAQASEVRRMLEAAIDSLPETLRVAFVLREVDGLSTAETAETLGIAEDAVKTRLLRARRSLRERIERELGRTATGLFRFDGERCDRIVERVLTRIRTL